MQCYKGLIIAALAMSLIVLPIVDSVRAYSTGEWDPWGPPPPSYQTPPAIPTLGDHFVNCPDAGEANTSFWSPDFYYCQARTGDPMPLYGTSPLQVVSGSFVNGTAIRMGLPDYPFITWPVQTLPPWNSTIHEVYITAHLYSSTWVHVILGYYTDFEDQHATHPWGLNWSSQVSGQAYHIKGWCEPAFRVTTLESWTPEMLENVTFRSILSVQYDLPPEQMLQVDYLGVSFNYTLWNESSSYIPPAGSGGSFSWDLGNVTIGAMGFAGFIGMIAVPAVTIVLARDADDRIVLFAKMCCVFAAFFALFLVGIG